MEKTAGLIVRQPFGGDIRPVQGKFFQAGKADRLLTCIGGRNFAGGHLNSGRPALFCLHTRRTAVLSGRFLNGPIGPEIFQTIEYRRENYGHPSFARPCSSEAFGS